MSAEHESSTEPRRVTVHLAAQDDGSQLRRPTPSGPVARQAVASAAVRAPADGAAGGSNGHGAQLAAQVESLVDYSTDPWTLLFVAPALEKAYLHYQYVASGGYGAKLYSLLAIAIWGIVMTLYTDRGYWPTFAGASTYASGYWLAALVGLVINVVLVVMLFLPPLGAYREYIFLALIASHWPTFVIAEYFAWHPDATNGRFSYQLGCYYFCCLVAQPRFVFMSVFLVVAPVLTLLIATNVTDYWDHNSRFEVLLWAFPVFPLAMLPFFEKRSRAAFVKQLKAKATLELVEVHGRETVDTVAAIFPPTPTALLLLTGGAQRSVLLPDTIVIQTDVAGFTKWMSATPPADAIRVVSRMFAHIDEFSLPHNVEKIHTVGDSFVGAIFPPSVFAQVARGRHRHELSGNDEYNKLGVRVLDAVLFGIAIRFATGEDSGVNIRIGVAHGDVFGAFVGFAPPKFDLFGLTGSEHDDGVQRRSVLERVSELEAMGDPTFVHVATDTLVELDGLAKPLGNSDDAPPRASAVGVNVARLELTFQGENAAVTDRPAHVALVHRKATKVSEHLIALCGAQRDEGMAVDDDGIHSDPVTPTEDSAWPESSLLFTPTQPRRPVSGASSPASPNTGVAPLAAISSPRNSSSATKKTVQSRLVPAVRTTNTNISTAPRHGEKQSGVGAPSDEEMDSISPAVDTLVTLDDDSPPEAHDQPDLMDCDDDDDDTAIGATGTAVSMAELESLLEKFELSVLTLRFKHLSVELRYRQWLRREGFQQLCQLIFAVQAVVLLLVEAGYVPCTQLWQNKLHIVGSGILLAGLTVLLAKFEPSAPAAHTRLLVCCNAVYTTIAIAAYLLLTDTCEQPTQEDREQSRRVTGWVANLWMSFQAALCLQLQLDVPLIPARALTVVVIVLIGYGAIALRRTIREDEVLDYDIGYVSSILAYTFVGYFADVSLRRGYQAERIVDRTLRSSRGRLAETVSMATQLMLPSFVVNAISSRRQTTGSSGGDRVASPKASPLSPLDAVASPTAAGDRNNGAAFSPTSKPLAAGIGGQADDVDDQQALLERTDTEAVPLSVTGDQRSSATSDAGDPRNDLEGRLFGMSSASDKQILWTYDYPVSIGFVEICPPPDSATADRDAFIADQAISIRLVSKVEAFADGYDGVQKIKSVGSRLLFVSGIQSTPPDLNGVARGAVPSLASSAQSVSDIVAFFAQLKRVLLPPSLASAGWSLRGGVHAGKCFGAVLGDRGLIFDVFGDAVNTASRMQTTAAPMTVQVSAAVQSLVAAGGGSGSLAAAGVQLRAMPPVDVKGKGLLERFELAIVNPVVPSVGDERILSINVASSPSSAPRSSGRGHILGAGIDAVVSVDVLDDV